MVTSLKSSIVFVITSLQGSGAESFVLALGKGFRQLGFEVHIVLLSQLIELDLDDNLHYHFFEYRKFKNIPYRPLKFKIMAYFFDRFLQKNIPSCQLVLSNLIRTDRMTCYSSYAPVAHVIHNTFSFEYQSALARKRQKTLRQFSKVYANHPCVCVSQGVEKDFKQLFGDNVQTTTIYNAFDHEEILQRAEQKIAQQNRYVGSPSFLQNKQYLISVGKFKYQKGHDVLLKAYAKSSQLLPLVLLGKGQLFEGMQKLAKDLGILDKVYFLGFNKNPYPFIKNAQALILSSRYEGFGRVIAEAQILDTVVISTDCPSGPNEMLPIENLVPVDDVDALASKLSDVMEDENQFYVPFNKKFLATNIAKQYVDKFL